jgi:hypothetical protein
LAVFVEGHVEVLFVEKLIEEIAGKNKVVIEHREVRGGTSTRRTMGLMKAAQIDGGQQYYVLIVDCGGDDLVKSRILEEHENLTKKGYAKIIGLRDVRGNFSHADIPKLEASLRRYLKTSLIPVEFILAVMEVEAWFLAETTHFAKIDPAITVEAIKAKLGFDPEHDDLEKRDAPAQDLNNCYALGGKIYEKHTAAQTVMALDFARMYLEIPQRFNYLQRFIASIESFLLQAPG